MIRQVASYKEDGFEILRDNHGKFLMFKSTDRLEDLSDFPDDTGISLEKLSAEVEAELADLVE